MLTQYGFPEGYFEAKGKENFSQFDRDSQKILAGFKLKFRTDIGLDRSSYLSTFSLEKWSELPTVEKRRHTLSNCTRCFEMHEQQQHSFPLKPFFQPQPVVLVDQAAMQRQGIKHFTNNVLHELNRVYENETNTSFTDTIVNTATKEEKIGRETKREKGNTAGNCKGSK